MSNKFKIGDRVILTGNSKAVTVSSVSHFTNQAKNALSPNILFMLYKRSKKWKKGTG